MDFYLQKLHSAVTSVTEGMSREDLSRRAPGKWCVAELLEHLYLTYTGTSKGFERVLDAGAPMVSSPTLKHRLSTIVVVGLGHMPEGRKAPAHATPRGIAPEKVMTEIGAQIAAMDEVIARAEAKYGAQTRVLDHPILGPLTAAQWRKFHWVHGRHHLRQIHRLRERT